MIQTSMMIMKWMIIQRIKRKDNVKDQLLFYLRIILTIKNLIREIIKNLPLMKKMELMKSFGEQLLLIRLLKVS